MGTTIVKKKTDPPRRNTRVDQLLTGESGVPVDVKVDVIPYSQNAILTHNLHNISDFSPMDFYMPLIMLILIFIFQFLPFGIFIAFFLYVVLVKDLIKRVYRRPSGPRAVGLQPPFDKTGWGYGWSIGFYVLSLPLIIGSIIVNLRVYMIFLQWLFTLILGISIPSAPNAIDAPDRYEMSETREMPNMPGMTQAPDAYEADEMDELDETDDASWMPDASDADSGMDSDFDMDEIPTYRGGGFSFWLVVDFLITFLNVVVLAPLVEEIWFRGIGMAGFLKKTGSPLRAVLWTSVIFGLLHGPSRFIFTTVFGVLLAVVRFRSNSLYCCMAVHALHNFLALIVSTVWVLW